MKRQISPTQKEWVLFLNFQRNNKIIERVEHKKVNHMKNNLLKKLATVTGHQIKNEEIGFQVNFYE